MTFKNKAEFVGFINAQIGVKLSNGPSLLNDKRKLLYTEINRTNKNKVLAYLNRLGVPYESHVKDFYWIHIWRRKPHETRQLTALTMTARLAVETLRSVGGSQITDGGKDDDLRG